MTTKPSTTGKHAEDDSSPNQTNESRMAELMATEPTEDRCDEFMSAFNDHCAVADIEKRIQERQSLPVHSQAEVTERDRALLDLNAERGNLLEPYKRKRKATSSCVDLDILASREQLIEAFGRYTGMNESWFNNLKDVPRMAAARKVTGLGGRGRCTEPLFCPLLVMLWLIDPKRRKGAALGRDKGWELLERYFQKVYAANSAATHARFDQSNF